MKHTILQALLVGSVISLAASGAAFAQQDSATPSTDPPLDPMVRTAEDFKNFDQNEDDAISLEEFQDQGIDNPEQFMEGLDANQDMQVSKEEWENGQQGGSAGQ